MSKWIARGGWPWILAPVAVGIAVSLVLGQGPWGPFSWAGGVVSAFMVYFFRDPERISPDGEGTIVSGADGVVRAVEELPEHRFLKADCVRISVFLSPMNVHVNRSPIAGTVTALAYTPGKHLLTIQNAASEYNEHSSILVEGPDTRCLVKQIVGPVVRRVVYWLHEGQELIKGERIGIMKFGSRMDMYFPAAEVAVLVEKGDTVRAGITVIAQQKRN